MLQKPKSTTVSIIAAMAKNRVIGFNNRLPWHLPADLKHFKCLTMGKTIVMGRKTFESIGKPLPGRRNVIISTRLKKSDLGLGLEVYESVEIALKALADNKEIVIIGGSFLFKQCLEFASHLYLTLIDHEFEGDTYFPEYDINQWCEVSNQAFMADELNPYNYRFVELIRL